jgi:hypothetical protein
VDGDLEARSLALLERSASELRTRVQAQHEPGGLALSILQFYRGLFFPEFFAILREEIGTLPPDRSGGVVLPPVLNFAETRTVGALEQLRQVIEAARGQHKRSAFDQAVVDVGLLVTVEVIEVDLPAVREATAANLAGTGDWKWDLLVLVIAIIEILLDEFGKNIPDSLKNLFKQVIGIAKKVHDKVHKEK